MKSPLTGSHNVKLEKEINCSDIIKAYLDQYSIDVSSIFQDLEKVQVYKCMDSNYRFYFPFEIEGDSKFYEGLMKYDWYYTPWKWEHIFCKNLIERGSKILEIGCAKGDFLIRIKNEIGVDVTGLELNKEAIQEGKKRGLTISAETVQEHCILNKGVYDLVCSFQVLEHISDVSSFIQSQIECLKENGKLVIAVPNNHSFIKYDDGGILNFPPHHMGLWIPDSIKSLENIFNIKFEGIYFEPLQEVHFSWFYFTQIKRLHRYNILLGKTVEKLPMPLFKPLLKLFRKFIKGHTMIAVFKK